MPVTYPYTAAIKGREVKLSNGDIAKVTSFITEYDGLSYIVGQSESLHYMWNNLGRCVAPANQNDALDIIEVI